MATDPNPITTPRSVDELTKLAGSQIDTEITGSTAPLQSQVSDLQGRQTSTLQKIGDMFGTIQPYVTGESDKVQSAYDTGFKATQSIFNTAQQRMAQLKNQRAQEAQAMAQEIGGPVAVGEFTSAVLGPEQELASTAPNVLLHSLASAEAGTQEARAFSGKVMPLVRTEQEANARSFFENQIKDLNSQIATLEASKSGKKNDRLNELLQQERTFSLNQNQAALDKIKSDRDWLATKRSLHNEDQRITMAKEYSALQKAGVTGTYKGKPTLAAVKASIAERQAAAKLNMSEAALMEKIRHSNETESVARQKLRNTAQTNAMAILDHAFNPSGKATLTLSKRVPTTAAKGYFDPNARRDPKTKQWYTYVKQTMTPQQAIAQGYNLGGNTPITDPQDLYNLLVGSGTNPTMALNLVRTRTGIGDFKPGGVTNFDTESLSRMTNKEIMGIARQRGYKGGGKRNELIHYIILKNPNAPTTGLPQP